MPPSSVCVICWLESLQQETPFLLVAEIHHAIDVCADWIHAMIVTSGLPTKRVFMMVRGDVDLLVSDVLASGGSPEVQLGVDQSTLCCSCSLSTVHTSLYSHLVNANMQRELLGPAPITNLHMMQSRSKISIVGARTSSWTWIP